MEKISLKGKQPLNAQQESLPWIEKYRPATLKDLVSHQEIVQTIQKFIDKNALPHLLFYGPAGVGKTSTILACARQMYGDLQMTLELNASDDRGIDVVREQIISFASTQSLSGQESAIATKLIILDECDSMTQQAQAALRRVMEKYSKNVRFCIICNYVSKIIPAIQSRCTKFRFAPLELSQVKERLVEIAQIEGVNLSEDGMVALLKLCKGDMRRALNVMQSVHGAYNQVNEINVYACVGQPTPADVEGVVNALLNKNFSDAYEYIQLLKVEKGLALNDLIAEVFQVVLTKQVPGKATIIQDLADLEYRMSLGCTEKIQLSGMVAAFQLTTQS